MVRVLWPRSKRRVGDASGILHGNRYLVPNRAARTNFVVVSETTSKKFDQLVELRNGIRHNRSVSAITSKMGEVAILWFRLVLVQ
jgi:hypothetical protein